MCMVKNIKVEIVFLKIFLFILFMVFFVFFNTTSCMKCGPKVSENLTYADEITREAGINGNILKGAGQGVFVPIVVKDSPEQINGKLKKSGEEIFYIYNVLLAVSFLIVFIISTILKKRKNLKELQDL